jgi:flagellar motility protein MotE (MotC chaperone)
MKSFRNVRVIPVVLVAIASLALLKVAGLVIDGGYVFDYRPSSAKPPAKSSWAQDMLNYPGAPKLDAPDITGAVAEQPKEASKEAMSKEGMAKEDAAKAAAPEGRVIHPEEPPRTVSASERAILERLQSRRQELEARAREIDIRESLLKAAEKRVESKVEELKAVEARAASESQQKSEAENARFKGLVTMYESMKPKDAAKVFDRLDMPVLIEIASQIAPRKMSDILGLMSPDAAQRLTVELAHRASGSMEGMAELPKIEGRVLPQQQQSN